MVMKKNRKTSPQAVGPPTSTQPYEEKQAEATIGTAESVLPGDLSISAASGIVCDGSDIGVSEAGPLSVGNPRAAVSRESMRWSTFSRSGTQAFTTDVTEIEGDVPTDRSSSVTDAGSSGLDEFAMHTHEEFANEGGLTQTPSAVRRATTASVPSSAGHRTAVRSRSPTIGGGVDSAADKELDKDSSMKDVKRVIKSPEPSVPSISVNSESPPWVKGPIIDILVQTPPLDQPGEHTPQSPTVDTPSSPSPLGRTQSVDISPISREPATEPGCSVREFSDFSASDWMSGLRQRRTDSTQATCGKRTVSNLEAFELKPLFVGESDLSSKVNKPEDIESVQENKADVEAAAKDENWPSQRSNSQSESDDASLVYVPASVCQVSVETPPSDLVGQGSTSESSLPAGYDKGMQDEFSLRFGKSEYVLQSYRCALSRKILLQGRLYVSQNYMGFFSLFNDSTLFGTDTTVLFSLSEVAAVRKKVNAIFFDNSIEVELSDGTTYFFATFGNRDKAYQFISSLWDIHKKMNEAGFCSTLLNGGGLSGAHSGDLNAAAASPRAQDHLSPLASPKRAPVLMKRQASLSAPYEPTLFDSTFETPEDFRDDHWRATPTEPLKYQEAGLIWNVPIGEVFDAVFDNFHLPSNPYSRILKAHNASCDHPPPLWSPAPPPPFGSGSLQQGLPSREISFKMDFKQTPVTRFLRFPSRGAAKETFLLHILSERCFVVESLMQLSGTPLSDCFCTRSRFKATALSDTDTQLDGEFEVEFSKSTLLAGKIESETMTQLKANMKDFLQWATECFLQRPEVALQSGGGGGVLSPRPVALLVPGVVLVSAAGEQNPDPTKRTTALSGHHHHQAGMSWVSWAANLVNGLANDFSSLLTNSSSWRQPWETGAWHYFFYLCVFIVILYAYYWHQRQLLDVKQRLILLENHVDQLLQERADS
eukprot:GHVS01083696.1.p1 GENE.GHVS01083696.1~~GHVS01083696.1.p1  ORF type:complete len:935 (+),score=95.64 GHVS01083696.1:246-3050(+)